MSNPEVNVKIKPNLQISEPPMFKVIYLNDDATTMEFVVQSLIKHFQYTVDTALHITQDIHNNGSAVVAVLPYEIAEQRGIEITLDARSQGFPLTVKVESEA